MHSDLLSAAWSVALDDALEGLAVFFPYVLFLAAEADILLKGLGDPERSLTLCGTMEESLLLVCDKCIEDLLEFLAVAVGIEGKSRKGYYGLSEKACLKPGESGIDLSPVAVVALEHFGIVDEEIVIVLYHFHLLESVGELPLESSRVDLVD